MSPCNLLRPLPIVSFERKIQFSASQDLLFARSKCFTVPVTESRGDVWSIKPPDFSLKLYTRLSVPQKKKKKNTCHDSSVPKPSETKWRTKIFLPKVFHESQRKTEPPVFIASHRPPDALESELMFVKKGKYPLDPYKNPKPHDFRPVSAWRMLWCVFFTCIVLCWIQCCAYFMKRILEPFCVWL